MSELMNYLVMNRFSPVHVNAIRYLSIHEVRCSSRARGGGQQSIILFYVGIGGREPLVYKFSPCVNVLRYMIVQCGRESHLMS